MEKETRQLFNSYMLNQTTLNQVEAGTQSFNIAPTIQQKLEETARLNSDLLKKINVIGVKELVGEKLGLSVGTPIASRTDTSGNDTRKTTDPSGLSAQQYKCEKTNFDTHITYAKLDQWAKFSDFQQRISNQINQQVSHDRIMIGWNGTHVAFNTDKKKNPLLQDVNIGWIAQLKNLKPENVNSQGVKIGDETGHTFKNIDAAVMDSIELLGDPFKDNTDLILICGRALLIDTYIALVNENEKPTERQALENIIANKKIGGLPTYRVPYFPANAF